MGLDLLFCCVFAYWLMKHAPELVGEAAEAFGAGLSGRETPAAAARRQRLADAGIDPAAGGAFRQFAGNVLRDFWLDQDRKRASRRAANPGPAPSPGPDSDAGWWTRLGERVGRRMDAKVDQQAAKWRTRTAPPDGSTTDDFDGTHVNGKTAPAQDDADRTVRVDSVLGDEPAPDPPTVPVVPLELLPAPGRQETEPPTRHDPEPPQPAQAPYLDPFAPTTTDPALATPPVGLNVGLGTRTSQPTTSSAEALDNQPRSTATAVLEPEGAPMSNAIATRGIAVTGVVSGAAETHSIYRELDSAITEFQAQLNSISARMMALGEQTLSIVQFAGGSSVVVRMAQAAEALAAERASAARCGGEVLPLLTATRNEFVRRNS